MSEKAWTTECDWRVLKDGGPRIVSNDGNLDDIMFAVQDGDGYPCVMWENNDDPQRVCDIHNAWRRLSPATRKLLIEHPEAVEACVEAVRAESAWRSHQDVKDMNHGEWDEINTELSVAMTDKMDYAVMELALVSIAALPEET